VREIAFANVCRVRLEKWHALGNSFLVADDPVGRDGARLLCDPAFGVGADGVLELTSDAEADVAVRILNRDGSEAEVSGNGTRITAAVTARRLGRDQVTVRTGAFTARARLLADGRLAVSHGAAVLEASSYRPEGPGPGRDHRFVLTGNPHCILLVDGPVEDFPLDEEGPRLEHHPWFPERTNVEVVRVLAPGRLSVRVWERGVGETQACGSGACASAVAAILDAGARSPVAVEMPGGVLEVAVGDALALELTGPVTRVGDVELAPELAAHLSRAAAA
jgi:diaminopimelate epimerase